MFEARLPKAITLKRLLDAIKDLVTEATWDCSEAGIALQAMDSSHVSLVSLLIKADAFETFRCDRNISLGINLSSMAKVLKCSGNDDSVTIKCPDNTETVTFVFESPKNERVNEYEMKLMDIDGDHLGIPETEYKCVIDMPSGEFRRICTDLSTIGESVVITCTKDGVRFQTTGDVGTGNVKISTNDAGDEKEKISVKLNEAVTMTYSLRYFAQFTKATACSSRVNISLSDNVPAVVEYRLSPGGEKDEEEGEDGEDCGFVRYYLAPKIEDDAE